MLEGLYQEQMDYFAGQLRACRLCPRECGVNRLAGEVGYCGAGSSLRIASYCLHYGEEPPISGRHGSGTVFFAHCSMRCAYCQNYPISQLHHGNEVSIHDLARMMLDLEHRGAHNINLVTATHFLPMVVEAVLEARNEGLSIPIVYNTSGYERPETVRYLRGIIQIYLYDMRYWSNSTALKYSDAPDYPAFNHKALSEVIGTVGPGLSTRRGIATSGLIIRHLVLPSLLVETEAILRYIAEELPPQVHLSLMFQYFPANRATEFPEINRRLSQSERSCALSLLSQFGIRNGWVQEDELSSVPIT